MPLRAASSSCEMPLWIRASRTARPNATWACERCGMARNAAEVMLIGLQTISGTGRPPPCDRRRLDEHPEEPVEPALVEQLGRQLAVDVHGSRARVRVP